MMAGDSKALWVGPIAASAFVLSVISLPSAAHANPETVVPKRSITLGGSAIVKPKYEGSDEFEVIPIPLIVPGFSDMPDDNPSMFKKFRQRIKFRGLDDIRVRVLGDGRLQVGAVTGYITDRDASDGARLRGWGDVEGGVVLGGYSSFQLGAIEFDAAILEKVTGDASGFEVRFGAETTRQLTSRTTVVARFGTTFGSEEYMQTYFGVTPAQAARSRTGLPVYFADGGIKDVFVELGASTEVGDRWLLKTGVRYGRLLGEAADSPVVEAENQFSGVLGLGYRFDLPQ